MRKEIYKAIVDRLNSAQIGVNYISLWNQNTEQLTTQRAFATPAVFIEFEPIAWSQLLSRARSASIQVRLHIITETLATPESGSTYQDKALERFDTIEAVSRQMQGLSGDGFNGFMLTESTTDHNHERFQHDEECYVTQITDISAVKPSTTITGVTLVRK